MDLKISEGYSDATHEFGVTFVRDGAPKLFPRSGATLDERGVIPHLQCKNQAEALRWIRNWQRNGGNVSDVAIVAIPRRLWGLASELKEA